MTKDQIWKDLMELNSLITDLDCLLSQTNDKTKRRVLKQQRIAWVTKVGGYKKILTRDVAI